MTSFEKYHLLDIIWGHSRDYTVSMYSMPKVCSEILRLLSNMGYYAKILPGDRSSKIIQVDDQRFRIVRNKGWNQYDVVLVD